MPRTQIEIDIPDGYELACSTLRIPTRGELFIGNAGVALLCISDDHAIQRVIVRTAWQWPSWLTKAAAIAMDRDGRWFAYIEIPKLCDGYWSSGMATAYELAICAFDFTPPPCTDWRQSLKLNPNRKAK